MDETPKMRRKSSLSLSTRLNYKRHSASPQNRLKTSTSGCSISSRDLNANCDTLQRSPSVISICSDGGIECTPPHKKIIMNLDDSLDYSPKVFDSSFSPTCLPSQTLAIDSPEVGWKWSRCAGSGDGRYGAEDISNRTPDSAYAADSSFTSAGSSSTELGANIRTRGDVHKQRLVYDARRENQRKILEKELRRVEKTREEEKLKQRCAKLREQLRCAGARKSKPKGQLNEKELLKNPEINLNNSSSTIVEMKSDSTAPVTQFSAPVIQSIDLGSATTVVKLTTPDRRKKPEILNDFFNDSDSDCLLLAATQEIESKIDSRTQTILANITSASASSEYTSVKHANSVPAVTTTPSKTIKYTSNSSIINQNKEQRSSFYMKFLEDDCPDDWFVSLDEVILQATQIKKPRSSLQRYKSMPTEAVTKTDVPLNNEDADDNFVLRSKPTYSKRLMLASDDTAVSPSSLSKMKRHSSTYSLSPASSNYRSRRQF